MTWQGVNLWPSNGVYIYMISEWRFFITNGVFEVGPSHLYENDTFVHVSVLIGRLRYWQACYGTDCVLQTTFEGSIRNIIFTFSRVSACQSNLQIISGQLYVCIVFVGSIGVPLEPFQVFVSLGYRCYSSWNPISDVAAWWRLLTDIDFQNTVTF